MNETGERDADLAREYEELLSMHAAVLADTARYQVLFDLAPTALVVTDESLVVREANDAASQLLDVEPRFLLGKPLTVYVDLASRRTIRSWTTRLAGLPDRGGATLRMRRRNGVAFDAGVRVARVSNSLYWSIVDRTAEAQAETRLWELNRELELRVTEQAAELEALVAQLPVGVVVVAADGGVAWANTRARAILGPELEARAVSDEHGTPVAREEHPRALALAGTTVRDRRLRIVRLDGREVVVDVTAVPVTSAAGGAVVVVHDATERAVVERADAEFVQNAAHQLRNPITAIATSAAALSAGAADDEHERARFIAHIERESERMGRVVDALLALGSVQRAATPALLEVVPLATVVGDAIAGVGTPGEVDLDVEIDADAAVVAHRDLLVQAIENVVGNAVEHTRGRVRVLGRISDGNVQLDVTDFGPGVDPEIRDRVFERFFRGGRNGRQGSGLGLAIARAAALATRSTLELLPPAEGEGATFRFTIPGARIQ